MIWTLTLTAGGIRMAWMNAPERLVVGTFVGLGCVAGLALPEVWLHSGAAAGALMLAGGVLYIAGALSYHRRWLNAFPTVFGYHEVFHVYVCAAAACQYTAIALFITSTCPPRSSSSCLPGTYAPVSTRSWHSLPGVGRDVKLSLSASQGLVLR
jgi:predicted membrane channel-forming protein YqfA (hemolysin III family)